MKKWGETPLATDVVQVRWLRIATLLALLTSLPLSAAPGDVDPGFQVPALIEDVDRVLPLDRGRSLWLGRFRFGSENAHLVRLNADGSLDPTFRPAIIEGEVLQFARQSDGAVVLGGGLRSINGVKCGILTRLHPNGEVDAAFNERLPLEINGVAFPSHTLLTGLVVDAEDRIYVSGRISDPEGTMGTHVVRLKRNGELELEYPLHSRDPMNSYTLLENPGGAPWALNTHPFTKDATVRLLAEGGIDDAPFVGLGFPKQPVASFLGDRRSFVVLGTHIALLRKHYADGALLQSVDHNGHVRTVIGRSTPHAGLTRREKIVTATADAAGRIYLGGDFQTQGDDGSFASLMRLFPDGTRDTGFHAAVNGIVHTMAVDSTGGLLIGGSFSIGNNGKSIRAARLLTDDSSAPPTFSLLSTNESAFEHDGDMQITVLREGAADVAATVRLTTQAGTAAATDLDAIDALLRFAPGERFKRLNPRLHDNDALDGDREINVRLEAVSGGAIGERGVGTVTILDNENVVAFQHAAARFPERSGNIELPVLRSNANPGLRVRYSISNSHAIEAVDLDQGEILFEPGSLRTTIRLMLVDNDATGRDRWFTVSIHPVAPAIAGTLHETTVHVADDDAPGFPGIGFAAPGTNSVNAILRDSRGRLLVGGDFVTANGARSRNLVRLLPSGAVDESFPGPDHGFRVVNTMIEDAEGRYLIGTRGEAPNLFRLNEDGSRDVNFAPLGIEDLRAVHRLELLPDQRIAVAASVDSSTSSSFRVLSASGIADPDASRSVRSHLFEAGATGMIADSAFWLRGNLYSGIVDGADPRATLFRLVSGRRVDRTFQVKFDVPLSQTVMNDLADGGPHRMVITGRFRTLEGQPRGNIARVFENTGRLDPSFANGPGANDWIRRVIALPDGRYLTIGLFTEFDGQPRNGIARLLSDGRLDESFDPGPGPDAPINTVFLEADGTLLVGGRFNRWNDELRVGVAHLDTSGALIRTAPVFMSMVGDDDRGLTMTLEVEPDHDVRLLSSGDLETWHAISTNRTARRVLPLQLQTLSEDREFFQAERLDP